VFAYGGLSFGGDPVRAIALLREVLSESEVVRMKEQAVSRGEVAVSAEGDCRDLTGWRKCNDVERRGRGATVDRRVPVLELVNQGAGSPRSGEQGQHSGVAVQSVARSVCSACAVSV
jgi:hypothetical protein